MKTFKNAISEVTFHILKRAIFVPAFLLLTFQLHTQNLWVGGSSGTPTAWENPRNWSKNHVPDEFDLTVIIPNVSTNSGYFPVIKTEVETISFLNVEGGAKLTIEAKGYLLIDGENTYNYGVQNTGEIYIFGQLAIQNTALETFAEPQHNIHNYGGVAFEQGEPVEKVERLAENK